MQTSVARTPRLGESNARCPRPRWRGARFRAIRKIRTDRGHPLQQEHRGSLLDTIAHDVREPEMASPVAARPVDLEAGHLQRREPPRQRSLGLENRQRAGQRLHEPSPSSGEVHAGRAQHLEAVVLVEGRLRRASFPTRVIGVVDVAEERLDAYLTWEAREPCLVDSWLPLDPLHDVGHQVSIGPVSSLQRSAHFTHYVARSYLLFIVSPEAPQQLARGHRHMGLNMRALLANMWVCMDHGIRGSRKQGE